MADSFIVRRGGGTDISDADAQEHQVLEGTTFYSGENNDIRTGTIPIKAGKRYIPTTSDQVVKAEQYLEGDQVIAGSKELVAGNIKQGIEMFGVKGTLGPENFIPGVQNPYYVYGEETVKAGDFVQFLPGISGIGVGETTEKPFIDKCNSIYAFYALTPKKLLVAHNTTSSSYISISIVTIDGLDYITESTFDAKLSNSGMDRLDFMKMSTTKFMVIQFISGAINYLILKVENNTISLLNPIINLKQDKLSTRLYRQLDSERFLIIGTVDSNTSTNYINTYARIYTVSENIISLTTNAEIFSHYRYDNGGIPTYPSYRYCISPDNSTIMGIHYRPSSEYTTILRATINHNDISSTSKSVGYWGRSADLSSIIALDNYTICERLSSSSSPDYIAQIRVTKFKPDGTYETKLSPTKLSYSCRSMHFINSRKIFVVDSSGSGFIVTIGDDGITPSVSNIVKMVTTTNYLKTIQVTDTQFINHTVPSTAVAVNAVTDEVEFINYEYETQVRKSKSNTTINGIALTGGTGGLFSGENAGHNEQCTILSYEKEW